MDRIVRTISDVINRVTDENLPISEVNKLRTEVVDDDAVLSIIDTVFVVHGRIFIFGVRDHIVPSIKRMVKEVRPFVVIQHIRVDEVDIVVLLMRSIGFHNKRVPVAQGTTSVDRLRDGSVDLVLLVVGVSLLVIDVTGEVEIVLEVMVLGGTPQVTTVIDC